MNILRNRITAAAVAAVTGASLIAPTVAVAQTVGEDGSAAVTVDEATAEYYRNAARPGGVDANGDGIADASDQAGVVLDAPTRTTIPVDTNGDGSPDVYVDVVAAMRAGFDQNRDGHIDRNEAAVAASRAR